MNQILAFALPFYVKYLRKGYTNKLKFTLKRNSDLNFYGNVHTKNHLISFEVISLTTPPSYQCFFIFNLISRKKGLRKKSATESEHR